jgi:hypothetical protein
MTQQTKAQRLAEMLEQPDDSLRWADGNNLIPQAAAELRRLHAVNAQLLETLEESIKAMRGLYGGWRCETAAKKADATIAAIREALAEQPEFVLPGGGYIPATPCPRSKLQK